MKTLQVETSLLWVLDPLKPSLTMSEIESIVTPTGLDGNEVESQRNINLSNGLCIHLDSDGKNTDVFLFDNVDTEVVHNDRFFEYYDLEDMLTCFRSFDGEMNRAIKIFFGR